VRNLIREARFRRDVRLAEERGCDVSKLREAIVLLATAAPLPARYKDPALGGNWKHYRDCPLEPDWLLIYKSDGEDLYLVRTGTHTDLFRGSRGEGPVAEPKMLSLVDQHKSVLMNAGGDGAGAMPRFSHKSLRINPLHGLA
jgi:mRNA interferase YafQ